MLSSNNLKLLNKNLNSVPTLKKYSKKQPDTDAENFFRLISLWAHFKGIDPTLNADQEHLLLQIKNKQKWTPKGTHHNVSAFIDLVKNCLNEEKNEKNEKLKTQSIQRGTESIGGTCENKEYCYNQCRQNLWCSNNGCRKAHQRSQPPTNW